MWLQQRVLGGIQKASESVQQVLGEIDHQLDESLKHGKPIYYSILKSSSVNLDSGSD